MALRFDPVRTRKNFDTFLLKMELSPSTKVPLILGAAALMRLATIVEAWLVGLSIEIDPALQICYEWLVHSIETNESLGDTFIPAIRSGAFGLCHWMLNNENNTSAHLDALNHFEIYFESGGQRLLGPDIFDQKAQRFDRNIERGMPVSEEDILNGYLVDYLANCIEAKEYERGVSLYERVGGETDIDPMRMKTIIQFGYWLCRQKVENDATQVDAYVLVGERVLKAYLQGKWLNHGQSIRAATWLKIVYWHSGMATTPVETILRAYELMPDVHRPAFV